MNTCCHIPGLLIAAHSGSLHSLSSAVSGCVWMQSKGLAVPHMRETCGSAGFFGMM